MAEMTIDKNTENLIRRTDNSLKDGDLEGIHQEPRPLTEEEIADYIATNAEDKEADNA